MAKKTMCMAPNMSGMSSTNKQEIIKQTRKANPKADVYGPADIKKAKATMKKRKSKMS